MIIKLLIVLGWILLAAVLLLLLLLLLVLFFPISYRLRGIRDEERMEVFVKIRWFFGLVRVDFRYPKPGNLVARALGIPVMDTAKTGADKDKKKGRKESGPDTQKEDGKKEDKADNAENAENTVKKEPTCACSPGQESCRQESQEQESQGQESLGQESLGQESFGQQDRKQEKKPIFQTMQEKWENLQEGKDNLYQKVSGFAEKLKDIFNRVQYYLELIQKEDSKLLFASGFFRLGRILRTIRPRKIKGQILIGTGSPDTTGYCMAVYGMLSPYLGKNISVTPDFENAVLRGELFVRGRITVVMLLFHSAHVLFDRRLHGFVKQLKMEGR